MALKPLQPASAPAKHDRAPIGAAMTHSPAPRFPAPAGSLAASYGRCV